MSLKINPMKVASAEQQQQVNNVQESKPQENNKTKESSIFSNPVIKYSTIGLGSGIGITGASAAAIKYLKTTPKVLNAIKGTGIFGIALSVISLASLLTFAIKDRFFNKPKEESKEAAKEEAKQEVKQEPKEEQKQPVTETK